jgi:hypothetical protein
MLRYAAALSVVLACPAAGAQDTPELHLGYDAYAAGLNVVKLTAALQLTPVGYQIDVDYHTAGLLGAIVNGEMHSTVVGRWAGQAAEPSRYDSYGHFRGRLWRTLIDYFDGQPQVRILEPPGEAREPVPPAMEHNALDALSAMALLVHEIASTGRCDGGTTIFDGRRVSEVAVRDAGTEILAKESSVLPGGPAHRCEFEWRQTAGFVRDADREELARPQRGTAWLTPLRPGGPPVPVRVSFHTRFLGNATIYLVDAGDTPGTAAR